MSPLSIYNFPAEMDIIVFMPLSHDEYSFNAPILRGAHKHPTVLAGLKTQVMPDFSVKLDDPF